MTTGVSELNRPDFDGGGGGGGGGRLCVVEAQEGEAWGRGVYVCCGSTGRGGDMCAVVTQKQVICVLW